MTGPLPVPTLDEPDRTLAGRLSRWLAAHDPGGIDRARASHLALSFVLVILTGYATSAELGLGMDVIFPMAGAMTASVLITFTPAAGVKAEARTMARLFAITCALMLLVIAVAPGNHAVNAIILKLGLVPLSFVALYLRVFGMEGQRAGLALIIIATIAAILQPTRTEAAWLLVAVCQGAAITAVVRLATWRPSALAAYLASAQQMQDAAAVFLRQVSESVRERHPMPEHAAEVLEMLRSRVWIAVANASAEAPEARGTIERLRAAVYRLRVAVQLLASSLPDPQSPNEAWRMPFASAADFVARRLETIETEDTMAEERFEHNLAMLRRIALSDAVEGPLRLSLLRAVTAFERLALVVTAIGAMEATGLTPQGSAPPAPPPAPAQPGLSPAMRVALQGLAATSITTALDFAFGLDHAYWATMTVMFVIGNSVGETYNRVRYRTVGTVIGVLAGMLSVFLFADHVWLLSGACLIGQMIALITLRDRYDIASAATGFSVVVALHLVTGLGADGMFSRIYETAIGAGVALLVSYLLLPVYLTDQIAPELKGLLRRCRDAFGAWWPGSGDCPQLGELVRHARTMTDRLPHLGAESSLGHRTVGDLTNIISTLDVMLAYLGLLEDAANRLARLNPGPEMVNAIEAARSRTLTAFDVALGEAGAETRAAATPVLEAAVSSALDTAQDEAARRVLPMASDYLAYSDAILRPLGDLARLLNAGRKPAPRAAATPPAERRGA